MRLSRRSALVWALVFLVLAFAGGGGTDLLPDDGDGGGHARSDGGRGATGKADGDGAGSGGSLAPGSLVRGRVTRVVDGDTVTVRLAHEGTETVRYIGVDTPESVKPDTPVQCFAKPASAFNRGLVEGQPVRLRVGREARDRYGRLLAYVFVIGDPPVFVNAELVRRGFARTLEFPPNTDRAELFAALERSARAAGRGLWSACPEG
jgi:micrococcal nuclease